MIRPKFIWKLHNHLGTVYMYIGQEISDYIEFSNVTECRLCKLVWLMSWLIMMSPNVMKLWSPKIERFYSKIHIKNFQFNMVTFHDIWWYLMIFCDKTMSCIMICNDISWIVMTCHQPIQRGVLVTLFMDAIIKGSINIIQVLWSARILTTFPSCLMDKDFCLSLVTVRFLLTICL